MTPRQTSSLSMKRALATAFALVLAATVAACGSSDQDLPPVASNSPTAPTLPPTTTPTAPAWQSTYTAGQLTAYDAALVRWKEYVEKSNQIYAEGVETPGAEAVFKEYTAIAPSLIAQLKADFEEAGVKVVTPPKALWWMPTRINGATYVKLEQCSDFSVEKVEQNGKAKPLDITVPRALLRIEMEKPKGRDWLVYSIKQTRTPCSPTD